MVLFLDRQLSVKVSLMFSDTFFVSNLKRTSLLKRDFVPWVAEIKMKTVKILFQNALLIKRSFRKIKRTFFFLCTFCLSTWYIWCMLTLPKAKHHSGHSMHQASYDTWQSVSELWLANQHIQKVFFKLNINPNPPHPHPFLFVVVWILWITDENTFSESWCLWGGAIAFKSTAWF